MYNTQPTSSADARSRSLSVAIIGIAIIAAGAVLLAGNLGLIDAHYVFRNFGPVGAVHPRWSAARRAAGMTR